MLRTVSKTFCPAAAHPQQPIRPQLICWRRPATARPRAPERGGEFLLQELLEETADPTPASRASRHSSPTSTFAVSVVIGVISFGGR